MWTCEKWARKGEGPPLNRRPPWAGALFSGLSTKRALSRSYLLDRRFAQQALGPHEQDHEQQREGHRVLVR